MKPVKIIYGDEEINIKVLEDQSILDASIEADIDLPYSCQAGVCGECKTKLLSGEVNMETNDALSDEEIDSGYILTCQAHPESDDVVVEYDDD